ncbi:MAG TPA: hypothetical protein DDZ51_10730 [Planctomycetaceae bacterium]|nr:hypothetical protein [Planctomycetaceae bacterium]
MRAADQPIGPRSGEIVDCVLLERRTKKGGWIASLVGSAISGPVTNSYEMPSDLVAGDRVRLKLCGIRPNTVFAQFAWTGA